MGVKCSQLHFPVTAYESELPVLP